MEGMAMPIEIQSFEFGEHTGYHRVFVTIHMQTDRGPHCFPLGFIEDSGPTGNGRTKRADA
jgi:hypothetical protein